MELVHDNGRNIAEIEFPLVEQAIEQDFSDDNQDARLRIDAAVARNEANIVPLEAPADSGGLHLVKFLLGQRDQRRGVIRDLTSEKRLEQGSLSNQCF